MVTDYTSFNEIRAVLGTSPDELADSDLNLDVYATGIEEDLRAINPDMITIFNGIKLKQVTERTPIESRVYDLVKTFSTYSMARQVGTALPMLSVRSLSDGKASMSRFSGEPYKDVLEKICGQYELYRTRLIAAVGQLTATPVTALTFTLLRVSSPDYDPVTGEG